jgi:hypothetical protein
VNRNGIRNIPVNMLSAKFKRCSLRICRDEWPNISIVDVSVSFCLFVNVIEASYSIRSVLIGEINQTFVESRNVVSLFQNVSFHSYFCILPFLSSLTSRLSFIMLPYNAFVVLFFITSYYLSPHRQRACVWDEKIVSRSKQRLHNGLSRVNVDDP